MACNGSSSTYSIQKPWNMFLPNSKSAYDKRLEAPVKKIAGTLWRFLLAAFFLFCFSVAIGFLTMPKKILSFLKSKFSSSKKSAIKDLEKGEPKENTRTELVETSDESHLREAKYQEHEEIVPRTEIKTEFVIEDNNKSVHKQSNVQEKEIQGQKKQLQETSEVIQNQSTEVNKTTDGAVSTSTKSQIYIAGQLSERPKGFPNLGNTCYMDSILQTLVWTPLLHHQLFMHTKTKKERATKALYELTREVHGDESGRTVDRKFLCNVLNAARSHNSQFNGYNQQDSFEMYNALIGGIQEERLKEAPYGKSVHTSQITEMEHIMRECPVIRLLGGMYMTVFYYETCKHVELSFQMFTSICVPVTKKVYDGWDKLEKELRTQQTKKTQNKQKKNKNLQESIPPPNVMEADLIKLDEPAVPNTGYFYGKFEYDLLNELGQLSTTSDDGRISDKENQQTTSREGMSSEIENMDEKQTCRPLGDSSPSIDQNNRNISKTSADSRCGTFGDVENLNVHNIARNCGGDAISSESHIKTDEVQNVNCKELIGGASSKQANDFESDGTVKSYSNKEQIPDSDTFPGPIALPLKNEEHILETSQTYEDEKVHSLLPYASAANSKNEIESNENIPVSRNKEEHNGQIPLNECHSIMTNNNKQEDNHPLMSTEQCDDNGNYTGCVASIALNANNQKECNPNVQQPINANACTENDHKTNIQDNITVDQRQKTLKNGNSSSSFPKVINNMNVDIFAIDEGEFNSLTKPLLVPTKVHRFSSEYIPMMSFHKINEGNITGIERGLIELTQKEEFKEEELPCRICEKSGPKKTLKKLFVINPPPVLVLQINRFQQEYRGLRKIDDLVTYPKLLDFASFSSSAYKVMAPENDDIKYSLYGVVAHSGSLHGGHYVAYVKTSERNPERLMEKFVSTDWRDPGKMEEEILEFFKGKDNSVLQTSEWFSSAYSDEVKSNAEWYYISDSYYEKCSENTALNNRNAYVLFYERIN